MGIRQKRTAETKALLLEAGLSVFAEHGIEFATLDDIARTAGFTKGAIYRQFPSKGAFLLALFEQYAAVARSGTGARQASWFIPLTLQFAAHAMRDPLLRRRFAGLLAGAPGGGPRPLGVATTLLLVGLDGRARGHRRGVLPPCRRIHRRVRRAAPHSGDVAPPDDRSEPGHLGRHRGTQCPTRSRPELGRTGALAPAGAGISGGETLRGMRWTHPHRRDEGHDRGRGVPVAAPSRESVLSDAPDGARVFARIRSQASPVSQDVRDRTTPRAPDRRVVGRRCGRVLLGRILQ